MDILAVWLILGLIGVAQSQILIENVLQDEAARIGSEHRLNATKASNLQIAYANVEWRRGVDRFITLSDNGGTITEKENLDPENYGSLLDDPYDVYVRSMSYDLMGLYSYHASYVPESGGMESESASAALIGVESVVCDPQPPHHERDKGDYATFICSVNYRALQEGAAQGSGYVPKLEWLDETGINMGGYYVLDDESVTKPPYPSPLTVTFIYNATATVSLDSRLFTCRLSFDPEPGSTNAPPTYTDSCTAFVHVMHSPENIVIKPNADDFEGEVVMEVGQQFNCTASSRPEADFYWLKYEGEGPPGSQNTPFLDVVPEMTEAKNKYECIAENSDFSSQARKNITFTAVWPSTDGAYKSPLHHVIAQIFTLLCFVYLLTSR